MISNVTFSGREAMLTKGLSNTVKKTHEYVSAAKIYSPDEIKTVDNLVNKAAQNVSSNKYTSPFALTSARNSGIAAAQAQADNYSYAIAHGKPEVEALTASKINLFI